MSIEVVHGNATLNQATITFHFSRILMIKLHSPLEQHNSTLQMWYCYTYHLPPDVIGSEYTTREGSKHVWDKPETYNGHRQYYRPNKEYREGYLR